MSVNLASWRSGRPGCVVPSPGVVSVTGAVLGALCRRPGWLVASWSHWSGAAGRVGPGLSGARANEGNSRSSVGVDCGSTAGRSGGARPRVRPGSAGPECPAGRPGGLTQNHALLWDALFNANLHSRPDTQPRPPARPTRALRFTLSQHLALAHRYPVGRPAARAGGSHSGSPVRSGGQPPGASGPQPVRAPSGHRSHDRARRVGRARSVRPAPAPAGLRARPLTATRPGLPAGGTNDRAFLFAGESPRYRSLRNRPTTSSGRVGRELPPGCSSRD